MQPAALVLGSIPSSDASSPSGARCLSLPVVVDVAKVAETFEFPLDGSDPAAALALEVATAARRAADSATASTSAAPVPGPADAPRRLADVARLDTCVTVVDAASLLDNLHSLETLKVGSG